jgi:hypothetical protein
VQWSFFRRRLHKHGHLAPGQEFSDSAYGSRLLVKHNYGVRMGGRDNQSKILSLSYCRGFLFFSYDGSSVISFDDTGDKLMSRLWRTVTENASLRVNLLTSEPYGTVAQHLTQDLFLISVSAQILLVDGKDICSEKCNSSI